jgi:hypothetical protein
LGYVLSGAAGAFFTPGGQRDIDESFLVIMNAYYSDLDFCIPSMAAPMSWEPLVDTSQPTGRATEGRLYAPGEVYRLPSHSFVLFINRAPRPEPPATAASDFEIAARRKDGDEPQGFYDADANAAAEPGGGDAPSA